MHPAPTRTRRLAHGLLIGALLLGGTTSCVSKALALKVVDSLEATTDQRDKDVEAALRSLVQQSASTFVQAQTQKIEAKRSELRARTYADAEKRIESTIDSALTELEKQLEPIVDDLQKQLDEAKASGDRAKEFEAAAKLGATLTVHARESLRLSDLVRDKFRAVRDKFFVTIDEQLNPLLADKTLVPDAAKITEETLTALTSGTGSSAEYRAAVREGFGELRRYIQDGDKAATFFTKGLLGGKLGETISSLVQTKLGTLGQDLETKLTGVVGGLTKKFGDQLDTVKPLEGS